MAFCPNCGNDLGDTHGSFCIACGKPLEEPKTWENAEDRSQTEARYDAPSQPQVRYVERKTNGLAIAGFITSFFTMLVGLILSWIALSQIKDNPDQEGRGLAIAGIIISAVKLVFLILMIVLAVVLAVNITNSPYYYHYGEFFS